MNTPGQNANAVAELVFGMLIYLARGKFDGKIGSELRGKALGVHALGAVGRAVVEIARGFGMNAYGYDPHVPADVFRASGVEAVASAEALYEHCAIVSLHLPATKETKGSIGQALLSRMPKGATLVNTARKEVIDEAGLLAVLEARKDFRYATDVAPGDATLATIKEKFDKRVYVTPAKMGAQTEEANVNAGLAAARQIVGYFDAGERRFIVN
jgi:D-3-phosphoglycerate dehydrogenase